MKQLFLEDLANYTEAEIKSHLIEEYSGTPGTGYWSGESSSQEKKN